MEVLGAVSSAVALAEIFAKSILTTKKLWDEAQGVPEEINRLMNDLTHLTPMLEEAEAVFNDQVQNPSTDTALLLIHNYKEVSGKLHLLAADLDQRIVTAKKGRRNLTKLKATLSKTLVQRYQRELDSISQILSVFFNVYNIHSHKESQSLHLQSISLQRNTDDKICQLLSLVQSHLLTQTTHNVQLSQLEGDADGSNDDLVEDAIELPEQDSLARTERRQRKKKPTPIEWRRPRILLGGCVYRTSDHPEKPGTQVFQLRLQLPWCLSGRAWDFEAFSSPTGWNMTLKPWTTRSHRDQIFKLVKIGSWPEIAEYLNDDQASISDRDEWGQCLLHYALRHSHYGVARNLVDMGFEIEGSSLLESIDALWYARNMLMEYRNHEPVQWFQCAADLGFLEPFIETVFKSKASKSKANNRGLLWVTRYLWNTPELLSLFVKETILMYDEVSDIELFYRLSWNDIDPRSFLKLCRDKGIDPKYFREKVMSVTENAGLADFASAYFPFAPGTGFPLKRAYTSRMSNDSQFACWKELAVWIFTDISVDELVGQSSGCPWKSSPFLSGLIRGVMPGHFLSEPESPFTVRLKRRRLDSTVFSWLEDVQASNVDLAEYGRLQLEMHNSSHQSSDRWYELSMRQPGEHFEYGPRLVSFTFGSRPQDWRLKWDPDVEEFAGDFWELTDNPLLHIPGAYPEDGRGYDRVSRYSRTRRKILH